MVFIVFWQFSFNISNAAITCLLKFIKFFLKSLGNTFSLNSLITFSEMLPLSLATCYKYCFGASDDSDFICYVVCPVCKSVYDYDDCVHKRANGLEESKHCKNIAYPNHPHQSQRQPCSAVLLKKVKTKKKYTLRPHLVYPYKSLQDSIQQLCERKGFLIECEKWRNRTVQDGVMGDIYDGRIWSNFLSSDCFNFLTSPHCFLVTLNTDWFQPFDRTTYSVGVLYLTIQNLPRHLRYRIENVIIVGIIPGPKEPKKHMNSFLSPLVSELQEAWETGFDIAVHGCSINIKVALSCIACDIPATRKICGFLSHSAKLGCNKCLKAFPSTSRGCHDYSGFTDDLVLRSEQQHRDNVEEVKKAKTKSSQKEEEAKYGVRYSKLLDLTYFDPVRFVAIDVMHNLYLGTCKLCFEIWVEDKILTKTDLKTIENSIELFQLPCDVGRIPSQISSCHGSFTAIQWKHWITIYSAVVLKGVLDPQHLQCWLLYVQACALLCRNVIKRCDVECAHLYIKQFCSKFQSLYGNGRCTINTHLHIHLKQIFMDFGPPHSTWCFAFERYNGILGSYHTNKKEIEKQLMKKFSQAQKLFSLELPFNSDILPLQYSKRKESHCTTTVNLMIMAQEQLRNINSFRCDEISGVEAVSPHYDCVLTADECEFLKCIYLQLYPQFTNFRVSPLYKKCGRISFSGDLIGSEMPGANSVKSSVITAFWPGKGNNLQTIDYSTKQVGVIQYFLIHYFSSAEVDEERHIFAYVKWKQPHRHQSYFGKSAIVSEDQFEVTDACCFLPVQRISNRCAYALLTVSFPDITERVFVACPLEFNYML